MASNPSPLLYGVPAQVIADLCGVTPRLAKAYKEGRAKPAPAVLRLVSLYIQGRILGPEFDGWAVRGNRLCDPEGHSTTQSQLRAYVFVWQLARELSRGDAAAAAMLDGYAHLATERLKRQRLEDLEPGTLLRFAGATK
jgi:hypothetical protein